MLEGKAVAGEMDMLSPHAAGCPQSVSQGPRQLDVTEPTDIARFIKQEFDRCYGGGWKCIVGTDFGSFVTHCHGFFIHVCVGSLTVLLLRGCECPNEAATQADDCHVLEEIIV